MNLEKETISKPFPGAETEVRLKGILSESASSVTSSDEYSISDHNSEQNIDYVKKLKEEIKRQPTIMKKRQENSKSRRTKTPTKKSQELNNVSK